MSHLRNIFLLVAASAISTASFCQFGPDSLLLNERALDRPLNLHKGQLRIGADYGFQLVNTSFDRSQRIQLIETGQAGVAHGFELDLKYGITEFLQASFNISHLNQAVRDESVTLIEEDIYEITYTTVHRGISDPHVELTYRLPLPRKVDLLFSGLVNLPVASKGYLEPEHSVQSEASEFGDVYTVQYVEVVGQGRGIFIPGVRAQFKYRLKDVAFTLRGLYMYPAGISTDHIWDYRIENNEFIYSSASFSRQEPDIKSVDGLVEYQVFPWFNVSSGFVYRSRQSGWTEETGRKILIPNSMLTTWNLSYELIVTAKLWLSQGIVVPLNGAHTLAPFVVSTGVKYNFFP